MAVQRDSITVVPPDGETVVVDILEDDVSLGTVHADRSRTRTLTLPLTITARTSFYVPVGSGPYDVSVKLGDDEIAGADGTPVTVSSFPAEIHARIDAAELGSVAGSGGSSAELLGLIQVDWGGVGDDLSVDVRAPGDTTGFWTPQIIQPFEVFAAAATILSATIANTGDLDFQVVNGYLHAYNNTGSQWLQREIGTPINVPSGGVGSLLFDFTESSNGSDLTDGIVNDVDFGDRTSIATTAGGVFGAFVQLKIAAAA